MKPPTLLLVDDDTAFRQVMAGELSRFGYEVDAVGTGEEAIRRVAEAEPEVVLLDLRLPGMGGLETLKAIQAATPATEVIMLTGHGSIDTAIESIRIGAFDYVVKPCPLDELQIRIQRALERRALRQRANLLERVLTPPHLGNSFIGDSPEFRRLLNLIDRVAPSDSTVLITGETGAGKEWVAKLIHARSSRRSRPFVVVECAALQESLLQSELFGHERGAFTGADRAKPGLFEVANGGTIFLDEIGEVSPATQTKLLRVLDTSTFRHVGSTREIQVDVRILTATNRDVPSMVRQGLFREDLFYRLSTITVEVPPLRARGADVDLLAQHFVTVLNERVGSCDGTTGLGMCANSCTWWKRPWCSVRDRWFCRSTSPPPCGIRSLLRRPVPWRRTPHCRRSKKRSSHTSGWRSKPARVTAETRPEFSESASGICTGNCASTACCHDPVAG
jgi:DNA-binding NtrC family response regulator